MNKEFPEVRVSELRAYVDPQSLSFESTAFDICQRKGLSGRQGVVISG